MTIRFRMVASLLLTNLLIMNSGCLIPTGNELANIMIDFILVGQQMKRTANPQIRVDKVAL